MKYLSKNEAKVQIKNSLKKLAKVNSIFFVISAQNIILFLKKGREKFPNKLNNQTAPVVEKPKEIYPRNKSKLFKNNKIKRRTKSEEKTMIPKVNKEEYNHHTSKISDNEKKLKTPKKNKK